MASMSARSDRTRIVIVTLTVIIGLAVASIPLIASVFSEPTAQPPAASSSAASPSSEPDATSPSSEAVTVDNPVMCPDPGDEGAVASNIAEDAELKDVFLPCLTDGGQQGQTSLAEQWAGKPTVVNVWAWWCGPCRDELPVMQQLAENNPQWNVVGVHLDAKAQAGVDFLKELEVTKFASYQDSNHTFDAATAIPKVVPVTLVYNPDGTRAELFVRTFDDVQEMQQLVAQAVGEA